MPTPDEHIANSINAQIRKQLTPDQRLTFGTASPRSLIALDEAIRSDDFTIETFVRVFDSLHDNKPNCHGCFLALTIVLEIQGKDPRWPAE